MSVRLYNPPLDTDAPDAPGPALVWWCEYQRACYLLESLAEDVFADQPAFDAWLVRQTALLRRKQ